MENFFVDDNFYTELSELIDYKCWDKELVENLPDNYTLEVVTSSLEPIIILDAERITEILGEERFSENGSENEISKIIKILNENIEFEKINNEIPTLYYPSRKKHLFTKFELLECVE